MERLDAGDFGALPNLLGRSHRIEDARHDLSCPRPVYVVSRFRLEQLRVRKDDPELVVQAVEEADQFRSHFRGGR